MGVFIDNEVTFKTHIENRENKISCGVGILEKTMIFLYCELIKPHLLFAIIIWYLFYL